jgi:hypothetical protein
MDDENTLESLPQVEHWLPPVEGREKIQFDYTSKLIELPDRNSPGVWSKKYEKLLSRALTEKNNFQALSVKLEDQINNSKRNRYYWTLSLSLYRLQSTIPDLLLALHESDSNERGLQRKGREDVKIAVDKFQKCWKEVENVYGETRFISYPPDYIPDRYFHLASQREDLTWMIQPEELFIAMIQKWL